MSPEPGTAGGRDPRETAVLLGLAALGLAVLSFVVLGFGRTVLGVETAARLAAPLGLGAFALATVLFVGFTLARLGFGPLSPE